MPAEWTSEILSCLSLVNLVHHLKDMLKDMLGVQRAFFRQL